MKRSRLPYLLQKATNRPLGTMRGLKGIAYLPIRWLARLLPYGHNAITADQWQQEYANGRWDYLHHIGQMARYSMIVGYYQHFKPGGSVLDLGCGDGVLLSRLKPFGYSRYVGVDLSPEAIARVTTRDANDCLLVADIEEYEPDQRFDVIIFNECLYYFAEPCEVIKRYERYLEPGGIFLVSLYVTEMNRHIWKMLECEFLVQDSIQLTHQSGTAWRVQALQPRQQQANP
jgi:2-polyprenyl-3-methyl-5-hydroxy-6-metoxy-1,4-benzoquinol methylase